MSDTLFYVLLGLAALACSLVASILIGKAIALGDDDGFITDDWQPATDPDVAPPPSDLVVDAAVLDNQPVSEARS